MKILSFKQFLNEMPLPIGKAPEEFDSNPGKYSSTKIIKAFEQMGVKIGKGSSRIAFKVDVEASQFNPEILKQYGLSNSGKVETVFKLALNPKGIAQNAAEIKNFNNAETLGHEEFILPILDTSTRNKKMTFADEELSNWIQMPLAPPPSKGRFKALFEQMYGTGVFDIWVCTSYIDRLRDIKQGSEKYTKVIQTPEQYEKFQDFLTALEDLELGINDLKRSANWGVWNNKLYIIDYGVDESTIDLYRGSKVATAYSDRDGNISLNTRNATPRRGW